MIVGLVGFAGAGKDTVAEYLERVKGFNTDSFASNLKDAASSIFGWDRIMLEGKIKESREWREKPDAFWSEALRCDFTPRMALQMLGTEACQNAFGKNIWVASLMKRIKRYPNVVVTDVRFSHEVVAIRDVGGVLIRVKRGDDPDWFEPLEKVIKLPKDRAFFMAKYDVHPSEWDWIGNGYDYLVNNDSDLDGLYGQIDNILMKEKYENFHRDNSNS